MDNRVYIIHCRDYQAVPEKMIELIDTMGGIHQFVSRGEQIVLKPNLLRAADPAKAVTTHPSLVAEIGRMVASQGAEAVIADSPGSGFAHSTGTLKRLNRKCGMDDAARQAGIRVNLDPTYEAVSYPQGKLTKRFEIITPVIEADGILNLCKLKTHSFMGMTGAVKNMFGVIYGRAKPGYHAKLHDTDRFATMMLDLVECYPPRISIMDAVVGMEGNGPSGGTPRDVGFLIGATNPLALDVVAGTIMGLDRSLNPVLIAAEKRGLAPTRIDEVELIGISVSDLPVPDYKLPQTFVGGSGFEGFPDWIGRPLENLFKTGASLEPVVIRKKCVACGACREACPMNIIDMVDKKYARIDPIECIRCYCCHEMCPEDAIDLKKSVIGRLLYR